MVNSSAHVGGARPMNIVVRRGSRAEDKYRARTAGLGLEPEEIAAGLPPTPAHDLLYHGGRTIPYLTFANFYVGGDAWAQDDIANINRALAAAMSEPSLSNVMAQYFVEPVTSTFRASEMLPGLAPARMSQGDIEALVSALYGQGKCAGFDLTSTVFNLILARGTVLSDDPAPTPAEAGPGRRSRRPGVPEEEEADSLNGLGGYHGSVQIGSTTIYYAAGVYSETTGGQTNGIPVFDAPWKNVVATFYHELNEARTDPDVEQVIQGGPASLLGWVSRQGEECGDFPVAEANPLTLVFQEVPATSGETLPVQFQYSNYVHGPEGPVPAPDPQSTRRGRHRV